MAKWTKERREKFQRTMASKKKKTYGNGQWNVAVETLERERRQHLDLAERLGRALALLLETH